MIKDTRSSLLLKIRQVASNKSIAASSRKQALDDFLQAINTPNATPQAMARAASSDINLSSMIITLANNLRRDMGTKPISDLEKATIRIGRLGCAEVVARLERAALLEKNSPTWKSTAITMQNISDAAIKMARKRAIDRTGADLVEAVFLTSLFSAGVFVQVFCASELDLPYTAETRRLVLTTDRDVTTLTLQALKIPADLISRVNQIGINTDDPEGMIADEVWQAILAKMREEWGSV